MKDKQTRAEIITTEKDKFLIEIWHTKNQFQFNATKSAVIPIGCYKENFEKENQANKKYEEVRKELKSGNIPKYFN